jgi:glycosyltransferase involved in cell wall biosynthesis
LDVPIDFIPNWAELELVEPRPRQENQLLKSLNLTDKFVFLYAGNMGYPNDLESLVQCISEMKEDDRFHFLFLGTEAKRRWLELQIEKLKLKNVSLLDPRPRHEQIEFLNACDVAIVSLVKGMRGVSVPSRIYNLLAAGKPILAIVDESSEVSKIVEEEGVGWVVEPSQPGVLHEKIIEIYRNKHLLAEMGERARLAAVSKYSLDHAMNKYREVLMK